MIKTVCNINFRTIKRASHQGSILYLDTANITENTIESFQTFKSIREAPSRAQRLVRNNTILISLVRPNLKHRGIINNPPDNLVVSSGFVTLDIKDEYIGKINPYYLYIQLCNECVLEKLCRIADSATTSYPSITPSDIETLEFDFPEHSIQNSISKIIIPFDRKIALNRKENEIMEKMAKQLYDYWFVQFDFPDENGRPYKSSGGAMEYNPILKREIPKGWVNCNLIDIANITMGQSPDGSSYNTVGDGSIFYQGSTDFGFRFPQIRQYTTAPTRFAQKGDILMSVRAPVGATNIANNNCCIGRGLCAISSKIGSMTHLYYVIQDYAKQFNHANDAGTTFGSITKDELYKLPTIKPYQEIIDKFEHICGNLYHKQMKIGEQIASLTALRDFLLPLLMNGQVTIKD